MDKYKLDVNELERNLSAPKMMKLADVQNQVHKVAFDVVTFRDSPETLWKVVAGEDGDYIVADYQVADMQLTASDNKEQVKTAWAVETDRLNKTATIFYKNTPITNINIATANIDDVEDFKHRIPNMLQKEASLVTKMINSLDEVHKVQVLNLHPELQTR